MITAKVGRRGQIVLPSAIRRRLAIKEGQRIAFVIEGEQVSLYPLNQTIFNLRGSVSVDGPQDFDRIRRVARQKKFAATTADHRDDDA